MQKIVVGIDEAGRGPLAGPVIAAAITVLGNPKHEFRNSKLRDSKMLSARQRDLISAELFANPNVQWGIGSVSEKQIDKINILQATRLAMKKAVLALDRKLCKRLGNPLVPKIHDREFTEPVPIIDSLIVDGNMLLDLPMRQKAIIKADATVLQCMAASIIAKVTRDRLMIRYHRQYPQYGFDKHKGYGTRQHFEALAKFGPCEIHRKSFSPVSLVLKFQIPNNKSQTNPKFQ